MNPTKKSNNDRRGLVDPTNSADHSVPPDKPPTWWIKKECKTKTEKELRELHRDWLDQGVRCYAELPRGGSYLRLEQKPIKQNREQVGGGRRGPIREFSRRSQKKMMYRVLAVDVRKVQEKQMHGLFFTLTYPGFMPKRRQVLKDDLEALWKRVERRWGGTMIWKLENQDKRGTWCPHFHCILLTPLDGAPYGEHEEALHEFRQWLSPAWSEVIFRHRVGRITWPPEENKSWFEEKQKSEAVGTNTEYIRDWGERFISYVGKYSSKRAGRDGNEWGERWGIKNRELFNDLSKKISKRIDFTTFMLLSFDLAQYYAENHDEPSDSFINNLISHRQVSKTVYLPPQFWEKYIIERGLDPP